MGRAVRRRAAWRSDGYGGYRQASNGGPPQQRTSSAPPPPMHRRSSQQRQQLSQYSVQLVVQLVQPQPHNPSSPGSTSNQYYEISDPSRVAPRQYPLVATDAPQLPPGAMPPVAVEQGWVAQQQRTQMNHSPTSPPPRQGPPPPSPSPPPRHRRRRRRSVAVAAASAAVARVVRPDDRALPCPSPRSRLTGRELSV